jgi:hypothetical protein
MRSTRSAQDRDPSNRDLEPTRGSPTKDTRPSNRPGETTTGSSPKDARPSNRPGETAGDTSTEDRDPSDRDPGTSGQPFRDRRATNGVSTLRGDEESACAHKLDNPQLKRGSKALEIVETKA